MILTGVSERELADAHFGSWVRHNRAFQRYATLVRPRRNWPMEILVLVGDPGTGKSRLCAEAYPDAYYVPFAKSSGCYWDFYEGQETVIIEEMGGCRFSYTFLLALLDRYPFHVPISGGYTSFCSRRIVMTTNICPEDWYTGDSIPPFEGGPLHRRLVLPGNRVVRVDHGSVYYVLHGDPLPDGWPQSILPAVVPSE